MRGRLLLAKCGLVLGSGAVLAQLPSIPQAPPGFPGTGAPAAPLPPGPIAPGPISPAPLPPLSPVGPVTPTTLQATVPGPAVAKPGVNTPGSPGVPNQNPVAQPVEVALPQPENKFPV